MEAWIGPQPDMKAATGVALQMLRSEGGWHPEEFAQHVVDAALSSMERVELTEEEREDKVCRIHSATHPDCDYGWQRRFVSEWLPVEDEGSDDQ